MEILNKTIRLQVNTFVNELILAEHVLVKIKRLSYKLKRAKNVTALCC